MGRKEREREGGGEPPRELAHAKTQRRRQKHSRTEGAVARTQGGGNPEQAEVGPVITLKLKNKPRRNSERAYHGTTFPRTDKATAQLGSPLPSVKRRTTKGAKLQGKRRQVQPKSARAHQ